MKQSEFDAYEDGVSPEYNRYIYKNLHDMVMNNDPKLSHRIPSFIINESIAFFERTEDYMKCHIIKKFSDENKKRIIQFERKDWMMLDFPLKLNYICSYEQ